MLNIPEILDNLQYLSLKGCTKISNNNLFYLDIDNAYIHNLFPLLKNNLIKKPDYFGEKSEGAHITLIYPEENTTINREDLAQKHHFLVKNIVTAEIAQKKYYVLLIESSSLLQLRKKYKLPDLLCFKGYSIGFHITIGVSLI
ncbi:MAG: hypothetical protein ABI091_29585 [Ferruginibacter sp.]